MTYPDGAAATVFLTTNDCQPSPSIAACYDAGGAKDIVGALQVDYSYNTSACASNQPHAGMLWVPETGQFSGLATIARDIACPLWTNYTLASTLASAQLTGLQGTWTDNVSPWDSFMASGPVSSAFGEWSVALFRDYLTNHFTANQLVNWGVLVHRGATSSLSEFDVRTYLLTVAPISSAWPAEPGRCRLDQRWLAQPTRVVCLQDFPATKRQRGSDQL